MCAILARGLLFYTPYLFIRCAIRNRGVPFLGSCCLMFKNSRFPLIPFRYSAHVLSPILLPRRLPNGKLRRLYPRLGLVVACYQRKSVYELMEVYILRTQYYFPACTPITCNEIVLIQFSFRNESHLIC